MAWTTPRTWTTGELVTAAILNTHVRDNLNILKTSISDDGLTWAGSGNITTSAGSLGVGTASPLHALSVTGNTTFQGNFWYVTNPAINIGTTINTGTAGSKRLQLLVDTSNVCGSISAVNQGTGSIPVVVQPSGGFVGIGTFGPLHALSVTSSSATIANFWTATTPGIGVGTTVDPETAGSKHLSISIATGATPIYASLDAVNQGTAGIPLVLNVSGGRVGIGNINPGYPLDVTGDANVSGDVRKAGTAYTNPDYVLEHWATGRIVKFARRSGARHYDGLRPLSAVEASTRAQFALPRIAEARATGPLGLFSGGDAVLATLEEAYLYLFSHERRLLALEKAA